MFKKTLFILVGLLHLAILQGMEQPLVPSIIFEDPCPQLAATIKSLLLGSTDRPSLTTQRLMLAPAAAGEYQCGFPNCTTSAEKLKDLKWHILSKHLKQQPYKCPRCRFKTGYPNHMSAHMKRKHEGKNLKVPRLSKKIQDQLDQKVARYMPQLPFSCDECPFTFETLAGVAHHKSRSHREQ